MCNEYVGIQSTHKPYTSKQPINRTVVYPNQYSPYVRCVCSNIGKLKTRRLIMWCTI
ncbi:hypothetical protein [Staphylococcus phage PT1-4]